MGCGSSTADTTAKYAPVTDKTQAKGSTANGGGGDTAGGGGDTTTGGSNDPHTHGNGVSSAATSAPNATPDLNAALKSGGINLRVRPATMVGGLKMNGTGVNGAPGGPAEGLTIGIHTDDAHGFGIVAPVQLADWSRPHGLSTEEAKRKAMHAISLSVFASCGLSADELSSLAAVGDLRSCILGARIFNQQEPSECIYIIESGEVHLEFATDAARNPDAPLPQQYRGGGGERPESPSPGPHEGGSAFTFAGKGPQQDDDDDYPLSAGEIFHTSAPNLGTFLSPLHGRFTLAEAQASTLAAEAAEEARRAKEAREAHQARRDAEKAKKEKERSDRLKQSSDMQFRGLAAGLLQQMTGGGLPGIVSIPSLSHGRTASVGASSSAMQKAAAQMKKEEREKEKEKERERLERERPSPVVVTTPTPQASPAPHTGNGTGSASNSALPSPIHFSSLPPAASGMVPIPVIARAGTGAESSLSGGETTGRSSGRQSMQNTPSIAPFGTIAANTQPSALNLPPSVGHKRDSSDPGAVAGRNESPLPSSSSNLLPPSGTPNHKRVNSDGSGKPPVSPGAPTAKEIPGIQQQQQPKPNSAGKQNPLQRTKSSPQIGPQTITAQANGSQTPDGTGQQSFDLDVGPPLTSIPSATTPAPGETPQNTASTPTNAANGTGRSRLAIGRRASRPHSPSTSTQTTQNGCAGASIHQYPVNPRRSSGSMSLGPESFLSTTGIHSTHGGQGTPGPGGDRMMMGPMSPNAHLLNRYTSDGPNVDIHPNPDASELQPNGDEISPGVVRVAILTRGQLVGVCGLLSPQQVYLTSCLVHSPGTRLLRLPKRALEPLLSGHAGAKLRDQLGERLLRALESASWLRSLPPSALVALASLFQACTIPAGTTLFTAGDCTADHSALYLITEGLASCEVADERGKPVKKMISVGGWVGELSVVVGLCRTGTARATTVLQVRYITRRSLFRFFQSFALLPLAASASRALLSSYPPLRDEQLLEQMSMQGSFARFCLKEFSAENIEFWQTAVRLRKVILTPAGGGAYARDQVLTEAALLYTRYISERSLVQINLKETVRAQVRAALKSGTLHSESFRPAEEEILHLMVHDNFARFKASKLYAAAKEELEAPSPYPFPNRNMPDPEHEPLVVKSSEATGDEPSPPSTLDRASSLPPPAVPPPPYEVELLSRCARVALPAVFAWNESKSKTEEEILFGPEGYVIEIEQKVPIAISPGPVVKARLASKVSGISVDAIEKSAAAGCDKTNNASALERATSAGRQTITNPVDGVVTTPGGTLVHASNPRDSDGASSPTPDDFSRATSPTPMVELAAGAFAPRERAMSPEMTGGMIGGVRPMSPSLSQLPGGPSVIITSVDGLDGQPDGPDRVSRSAMSRAASQRRGPSLVRHAPGAEMTANLSPAIVAAAVAARAPSISGGIAANPFATASHSAYAFSSTPIHKSSTAAKLNKKAKEVAKQFKNSPFAVPLSQKEEKRNRRGTMSSGTK